jgi:hypothetical protein
LRSDHEFCIYFRIFFRLISDKFRQFFGCNRRFVTVCYCVFDNAQDLSIVFIFCNGFRVITQFSGNLKRILTVFRYNIFSVISDYYISTMYVLLAIIRNDVIYYLHAVPDLMLFIYMDPYGKIFRILNNNLKNVEKIKKIYK